MTLPKYKIGDVVVAPMMGSFTVMRQFVVCAAWVAKNEKESAWWYGLSEFNLSGERGNYQVSEDVIVAKLP